MSYFESCHPDFPFLHGAEVLELSEEVAVACMSNIGEAEATIIRAMISISLADSRQTCIHRGSVPTRLVFLSQEHVASSLVFALGCPEALRNVQAAVSLQLSLVSMPRLQP